MQKYGIKGFPTVLMINEKNNKFIRYNGDRSKETLLKFAQENKNSELTDENVPEKGIIFFYADWDERSKKLIKEWESVEETLESEGLNTMKLESSNKEAMTFFGITDFPVIKIVTEGSKEGKVYNGPDKSADILAFAHKELADAKRKKVPPKLSKGPNTLTLFYASWCGHSKRMLPTWDELEKELDQHRIKYKKIESEDKETMRKFNIQGFPTIMMVNDNDNTTAVYSGDRSKDSLLKFAMKHHDKNHPGPVNNKPSEPKVEQPKPEVQTVKKTFQEGEKVLTLFYANWCGHSKRMLPAWDELEKELDNRNIKHNKIESEDKETMKKFEIRGFPTIKMVVSGTTEGQEYSGSRSKDDLLKFALENSGSSNDQYKQQVEVAKQHNQHQSEQQQQQIQNVQQKINVPPTQQIRTTQPAVKHEQQKNICNNLCLQDLLEDNNVCNNLCLQDLLEDNNVCNNNKCNNTNATTTNATTTNANSSCYATTTNATTTNATTTNATTNANSSYYATTTNATTTNATTTNATATNATTTNSTATSCSTSKLSSN